MSTTYHVTWRSLGVVLGLLLYTVAPVELGCAILLAPYFGPPLANAVPDANPLVLAASGTVGLILVTLVVVSTIYKTGTFLTLSPEGLEYHRWPFRTVTCQWHEPERIAQGNVRGLSFATLVIPREKPGWEIRFRGGALGPAKHKLVPLNEFEGWPDGDLANELRWYAPKLFP